MSKLHDFPLGSLVEYKNMHGTKCVGQLLGFFKIPNGMYEFFPEPRALIKYPCVITTNPITDEPVSAVTDYSPQPYDLEASEPSKEDINIRAKAINNWDYNPTMRNQWSFYAEMFPVDIKQFLNL